MNIHIFGLNLVNCELSKGMPKTVGPSGSLLLFYLGVLHLDRITTGHSL